jgi:adenine-specific DNA-methyltransferase
MIPAEKQFFMQRVHSLKKIVDKLEDGPSLAVKKMLYIWQSIQYPLLCKRKNDGKDVRLFQDKAFNDLASWLVERPFLDSAFWLSSAYSIWVGDGVRKEKSLYFTPPILAERLIDDLISHGASLIHHTWMDPACGGGAFLAPVAVRMVRSLTKIGKKPNEIIEIVSNNLVGNDIDRTLAYLSTQFLTMSLYDQILISNIQPKFRISVRDGLMEADDENKKADVIICNPPYRKMKSTEANEYKKLFSNILEGQPNIYGLFIYQCLKLGTKDALVGLLTPTSYLSGKYFTKLRRAILNESHVCQLDLVDDRVGVFIGVSQGAVLSLYKRSTCKAPNLNTEVYALSITGLFTKVGTCALADCSGAWPIPREEGDQEIISRASLSPYRMTDFGYKARIGAYVDYRDKRKTYATQPDNKKMKAVFPIIWSSDITSDGRLNHGRTSEQDGHHIFIEMGNREHSAVVRRPVIALQRVTSPDQPRRLVCAPIDEDFVKRHDGVVGENHVIFLEQTDTTEISTSLFAAILASQPIDRLFRSISGAVNVSVSELNQLTLPNPKVLINLIKQGHSINDAVTLSFKGQAQAEIGEK